MVLLLIPSVPRKTRHGVTLVAWILSSLCTTFAALGSAQSDWPLVSTINKSLGEVL